MALLVLLSHAQTAVAQDQGDPVPNPSTPSQTNAGGTFSFLALQSGDITNQNIFDATVKNKMQWNPPASMPPGPWHAGAVNVQIWSIDAASNTLDVKQLDGTATGIGTNTWQSTVTLGRGFDYVIFVKMTATGPSGQQATFNINTQFTVP